MAYKLEFTRPAARELADLLRSVGEADRRDFQRALEMLQANPYPTNPGVTAGTIRRLRGSAHWRFRVNYHYRIRYLINGDTVLIDRARHRRDAYL